MLAGPVSIDDILKISAEPLKRGRGRPRKDDVNRPAAVQEPKKLDTLLHQNHQRVDIIVPAAILPAIKFPYDGLAAYTQYDGFKLTESEAIDLSKAAAPVLQQYSNTLNSPHAALYAFLFSIAVITGSKSFGYFAERKKALLKKAIEAPIEETEVDHKNPFSVELMGHT